MEVRNPLDRENQIRISHVYLLRDTLPPGSTQAPQDRYRDLATLRRFLLKLYDAMEVLIMDQGTEFGADFQHLCRSRGIIPAVTGLETLWQNSVVERHGILFKRRPSTKCAVWKLW